MVLATSSSLLRVSIGVRIIFVNRSVRTLAGSCVPIDLNATTPGAFVDNVPLLQARFNNLTSSQWIVKAMRFWQTSATTASHAVPQPTRHDNAFKLGIEHCCVEGC